MSGDIDDVGAKKKAALSQRGPERPREAQRGPERLREAQRRPERPREAQRGPERAREAHRAPETPREAGTSPEGSKGALVARGPKMQFKQSILICFYIKKSGLQNRILGAAQTESQDRPREAVVAGLPAGYGEMRRCNFLSFRSLPEA